MKKHYKGLTVLLSACMLAGSASVAYAGPADDIANGTVGMPNTGSSTSAEQFNQGTGQQDENTALHVGVNYLYNAEGDISAFAMDLKNFEGIGGVSYRAYTNTGGYLWWYHDGIQTGVVGSGSWVEAIQIQLSGQAEKMYDVTIALHPAVRARWDMRRMAKWLVPWISARRSFRLKSY